MLELEAFNFFDDSSDEKILDFMPTKFFQC